MPGGVDGRYGSRLGDQEVVFGGTALLVVPGGVRVVDEVVFGIEAIIFVV